MDGSDVECDSRPTYMVNVSFAYICMLILRLGLAQK